MQPNPTGKDSTQYSFIRHAKLIMNDVFFLLLVKEKYENAPEETFTVTVKYQGQKREYVKET